MQAFIKELELAGVLLKAKDGNLKILSRTAVSQEILEKIKRHKAELLEYLTNEASSAGKPSIDCVIVGHNEIDLPNQIKSALRYGEHSTFWRDLSLGYIEHDGNPYSIFRLYNKIVRDNALSVRELSSTELLALSIPVIGSYLIKKGLTVDYVNEFKKNMDYFEALLESCKIELIALTTTLYVTSDPVLEIVDFIRKIDKHVKIVVGGPLMTSLTRSFKQEELLPMLTVIGADFYIDSAQGEDTLSKLIVALKEGTDLAAISNLYYKVHGQFVNTQQKEENNKIENNPIDWENFIKQWPGGTMNLRTAISCPYKCSFCTFPEVAGGYEYASVEHVKRELYALKELGTVKHIHFTDDTFNIPKDRFNNMLRMMIKENFGFSWESYYRCQFTDEESIALMRESGCVNVYLGIESGSNKVLATMDKAAKKEDYLRGIKLLKEYGIITYASFIIGFPSETESTVYETLDFIETSGLDFYRTQVWYFDNRSPISRKREQFKLKGHGFQWAHETMNDVQATDYNEMIFNAAKNCDWAPEYDFAGFGIPRLMMEGFTLDQVRQFLRIFKKGVQAKLQKTKSTCVEDLQKLICDVHKPVSLLSHNYSSETKLSSL